MGADTAPLIPQKDDPPPSVLKSTFDQLQTFLTTPHIEVTLRMTLGMAISYILVFADIRWITPIDSAPLMGIFVPFLVMLFPTLAFSFGVLVLPTFSLFLYGFISATMLLTIAVKGGTGAFIVSFGLWAFWNCFLRWNKNEGPKVSIILIAVVFQTVLIWPTFVTVQDGFNVPGLTSPNAQAAIQGFLAETVELATSLGVGTHELTVASGVMEGILAHVTIAEDNSASTYVPGGMWLVKGAWTFSGVNNPLAAYQNMMVFAFWLTVIAAIPILLPPVRTMRSAVWRGMIPAALKDAASMLRALFEEDTDSMAEGTVGTTNSDNEADKAVSKATEIAILQGKCTYHMSALFDGAVAKLTYFEPRLLDTCSKPPECTAGYLAELSVLVARVTSASIGMQLFTSRDYNLKRGLYLKAADNLDVCAKALAYGDESVLNDINYSSSDFGGEEGLESNQHDAFAMHKRTEEIVAVSKKWLRALGPGASSDNGSTSFHSFLKNGEPWVRSQFSHYIELFRYLLVPFRKSTWESVKDPDSYDFVKLVWCIKYALGMALLLVISVYWPAYQTDFALASKDNPARLAISTTNGGWVIVAYCFATTQTAEGSVKKGLLRMVGTVLGAFSGWLALLACEDSSSKVKFNPYGILAWMIVTSLIMTFISTERGFGARIALSSSYGYGPIYFVVTQAIVIYTAFGLAQAFGPEVRNEIALNRMVANLVGIAMAILLAVVPPGNYGGDPGHTRKINSFHWQSVQTVVDFLVSCDPTSGEAEVADHIQTLNSLSNKILQKSTNMQGLAVDFEKDAARLHNLPYLQVDPKLKGEIAKVTRDIYVARFIPHLAAKIMGSESRMLLLDKNGLVQQRLDEIRLNTLYDGIAGKALDNNDTFHLPSSESSDTRDDIDLLLLCIQWLVTEMKDHDKTLQAIKY